jgi:hypothetical protein
MLSDVFAFTSENFGAWSDFLWTLARKLH